MEYMPVGEVLKLDRKPIDPDPTREYVSIGIRSFGKGIFHYPPTPGNKLGRLRFFEMQPDRLVISNIKGWEGAIAVSSEDERDCVASNRFLSYAPIDERIDVRWARWYFLSEPGLEQIRRTSPGSADRNRTLAIDRFEALKIPVPEILDQQRQVEYLNAAAGWAEAAAERFTQQSRDSIVALLPGLVGEVIEQKSVGVATVSDLADFVSDIVHPGDDPAPADSFVGLQHIDRHTGRRLGSDPIGVMKGRKFRFRPGDVLYGYLRPYLNKVWVADRHGLCSVDQYVLRPHPGVSADLFGYSLRSRTALTRAIDLTHNLQLPRLRSGLVASLLLPTVQEADVPALVAQLDQLRESVVAAAEKREHQLDIAAAIVPSAMNHVFAGLT